MYSLISTDNFVIDQKEAISLLQYNNFPYQRSIRQSYVNELVQKIKRNEYTTGSIVMAITPGDEGFLVDGQHTLTAIIQSEIPTNIYLTKIKCHNQREIVLLWQQYDGGIPRSITDYVRSEIGSLDVGWSTLMGSTIAGAAVIATHGIGRTQLSKSEKTKLLKDYIIEGEFVKNIVGNSFSSAKHMKRQSVVAVMMMTHRISKDAAALFWTKIKTGEMLSVTDPRHHLRNFLMTFSSRGVALTKIASPREFYVRTAKAWNYFRDGKEMKTLRYSVNESTPTLK